VNRNKIIIVIIIINHLFRGLSINSAFRPENKMLNCPWKLYPAISLVGPYYYYYVYKFSLQIPGIYHNNIYIYMCVCVYTSCTSTYIMYTHHRPFRSYLCNVFTKFDWLPFKWVRWIFLSVPRVTLFSRSVRGSWLGTVYRAFGRTERPTVHNIARPDYSLNKLKFYNKGNASKPLPARSPNRGNTGDEPRGGTLDSCQKYHPPGKPHEPRRDIPRYEEPHPRHVPIW